MNRRYTRTTALEHVRYSCGIAGEEVADDFDRIESELIRVTKQRDDLVKLLEDVYGNINPERGYADELEEDIRKAIDTYKIPSL
jgi:hypothetical protein